VRHAQNRGLAAARNTGFRESSAPLVLPLDADDLLAPTCLREMSEAFAVNPATACVFGNFELFGAQSGLREYRAEPLAALTRHQWLPGAGVMMRRVVWERAGGYCEDAALRGGNEDWDFWLSAAEHGFSAVHLPRALYRYRQHATSMTITLRAIDHETRHFMHRRHQAFFARHGGARGFVADGYWRAAWAARDLGRPVAALLRSAQAVALDGDFRRFRNGVRTIGEAMLARLRSSPARAA
jgi:glycosyltransferase involved in cell wall biosynthesis